MSSALQQTQVPEWRGTSRGNNEERSSRLSQTLPYSVQQVS